MARIRNPTSKTTTTNSKGRKGTKRASRSFLYLGTGAIAIAQELPDGRTRSGKSFRHAKDPNIMTTGPLGQKSRAAKMIEPCQDDGDDPEYRMLCLDLLERIEEYGILNSFSSVQKASAVVLFASSALDTELLFDKSSAFLMPGRGGNVLAYDELFSHRELFEDVLLHYDGRLDCIPGPEAMQANQEEPQESLIEQPAPKARRARKRKKVFRGRKNGVSRIDPDSSGSAQQTPLPSPTVEDMNSWVATGRSALMQAGWLCAGVGLTYFADQVLVRRASH
ncbi:hypothetical protein KC340_g4759 [Hortaea werneckii]|nr:hypothetical protein KC342_g12349 [Hortaea werneckii]KAI7101060.1 hypothetical protein KC339_g7023 [Hortaea werneckii]KAI7234605.1 hypothetical protein KC365_g5895 [Hortaea werneckii]KAI7329217.1 hypothetical protein KC340_g4759 [Hortaea werneckii]KAI7390246.1 hypothetical protein KC328_g8044 [Hortaea werneckii]